MEKLAVVALGGNALLRQNGSGSIEEQVEVTTSTLENLIHLLRDGYQLVVTHGNGPQVGNILLRNDAGKHLYNIPSMPLDVCVADSQGGIGYMIERCMRNVLRKHNIKKDVLSVITMALVDPRDDAFLNPGKRVGKVFTSEEKEKLEITKGWQFKSAKAVDGWQRVVASPMPISLMNEKVIRKTVEGGSIVIAVGGGGVPVYHDKKGNLQPAEAVIDKDLASALLAAHIGADELYILTDVPYVYQNFGKSDQRILEFMDYNDAKSFLERGDFGEGSMRPKICAALSFIENGGRKAVITESTMLEDKRIGTKITMEYDPTDVPHDL